MRRNLIVVRSGKTSLHSEWLSSWTADAGWDLLCANFGGAVHRGTIGEAIDTSSFATKFVFLNHLLDTGGRDLGVDIGDYDYVWFPDDDLSMSTEAVSSFFAWCNTVQPDLAQPALNSDSYATHPLTCQHQGCDYRRTTFVEIMAPCFSRRAWKSLAAAERFRTLGGWGYELYMTNLFNPLAYPFVIFDAVAVTHTKQVGGPFYNWMPPGMSAQEEARKELERHSLDTRYGWYRCNLSLSSGNETLNHDEPGFIDRILGGLNYLYRRPTEKLRGLAFLQSSTTPGDSLTGIPIRIFAHATLADYLLMQINVGEWVEFFRRAIDK